MPEPKRKPAEIKAADLELEGFENFFDGTGAGGDIRSGGATAAGEQVIEAKVEKLLNRFNELITLSVDQRVETAKLANQLIENQRQLVATQQILIRLMERSLDLTRHVTEIEEKLPAVFELPQTMENLRVRVAQLEGIEVD